MLLRRAVSAVLACGLLAACSSDPAPGGGERFVAVGLDLLQAPPTQRPPEPDVSRTMFAAATLDTFEPPLDACRGPVAIDVQEQGRPVLVSEHDYCGGADWIPQLAAGDVVRLDGAGVQPGLYEVDVVDEHRRRQVYVKDLRPDADVVLQTCISQTRLILVALTRIGDDAA